MTRELKIGRSPESDILMADSSVSRHHASLIISDSRFSVRDCGSSNGTYINGMRINGVSKIQKNDILKVGNELVPWMNYVDMAGVDLKTEYKNVVNVSNKNKIKEDLPNASAAQTCGIIGLIFSVGLIGIVLNIIVLNLASGAFYKYRFNSGIYNEKFIFSEVLIGIALNTIALSLAVGAISKYRFNPDIYNEKSFRKAKVGQTLGIIGLSVFGLMLIVVLGANF